MPLSHEIIQVRSEGLRQIDNQRVTWTDIHGRKGISGLLPQDSPLAARARQGLRGITKAEVEFCWRVTPPRLVIKRPDMPLKLSRQHQNRRRRRCLTLCQGSST